MNNPFLLDQWYPYISMMATISISNSPIPGLTSPGFPAYAAAAGSALVILPNITKVSQNIAHIWLISSSFSQFHTILPNLIKCTTSFRCFPWFPNFTKYEPGPAPAGQPNPQQQPAEQRIQWSEGGKNISHAETCIYISSEIPLPWDTHICPCVALFMN